MAAAEQQLTPGRKKLKDLKSKERSLRIHASDTSYYKSRASKNIFNFTLKSWPFSK